MICHLYRRGGMYWGKLQLDGDARLSRFSLGTTDKRVAQSKLCEIAKEREKEASGMLPPRSARDAAAKPLPELLTAFLDDLRAKGRAGMTITKYENTLTKLFGRVRWRVLADITVRSFCEWRAKCGLRPKTLNDLLGALMTFLGWLKHQRLAVENPLIDVQRIDTRATHEQYRRSFTNEEMKRLLAAATPERRIVYQVAVLTGLRRKEMMGLRWSDVFLDGVNPVVQARASLAGNKSRRHARIPLHPELAAALREFRPVDAAPFAPVLAGLVPRIPRFRKDLVAARIDFVDELGRRADLHALRDTFITELILAGNPPAYVQQLARHSDIRMTMKYYADASRFPLAESMNKHPGYGTFETNPKALPSMHPDLEFKGQVAHA